MGLFELDSISIKTDSFAGFGYTDTFITELISLIETKHKKVIKVSPKSQRYGP